MDPLDASPLTADVRPGALWPWVVLAIGALVIVVGGVAFAP